MPLRISWIEEPTTLAMDFSGEVSVDDMQHAIHTAFETLRQNPMYFLIDMTASTGMDMQVVELSSLSEWIYHPNARWFIYVNPNRLFKNLMKLRHRGNTKNFEDRQQALQFLQHLRSSTTKI